MNVPWRFEYVDTSYELEPENLTEEPFDVKHFISVLEVFKHHYSEKNDVSRSGRLYRALWCAYF